MRSPRTGLTSCLVALLACGGGKESTPAEPAAPARSLAKDPTTREKHDRTSRDALVPGPALEPSGELLAGLDREAPADARPRRRIRLPVVVSLADGGLSIGGAFIGVSAASPGADPIALRLDDTALGVSLLDQVRAHCPDAGAGCALWLEGTWGPMIELPALAPPDPDAPAHTFAVLSVVARIDDPPPAPSQVRVQIQPAEPAGEGG
jgi:hypothetical protein